MDGYNGTLDLVFSGDSATLYLSSPNGKDLLHASKEEMKNALAGKAKIPGLDVFMIGRLVIIGIGKNQVVIARTAYKGFYNEKIKCA